MPLSWFLMYPQARVACLLCNLKLKIYYEHVGVKITVQMQLGY